MHLLLVTNDLQPTCSATETQLVRGLKAQSHAGIDPRMKFCVIVIWFQNSDRSASGTETGHVRAHVLRTWTIR